MWGISEQTLYYKPRLAITLVTSSMGVSSSFNLVIGGFEPKDDLLGGPYTLGNEGAVAELGLELPPVSPVDVVGDSG